MSWSVSSLCRVWQSQLAETRRLGNILIFLLAGHDTTAHALAMLLGLLALYPEEQVKLVQQIQTLQVTQNELVGA